MIILIGGEKGGTGKTTLATNLAAMLVSAGNDVLLVDTDKQCSASAWCGTRDMQDKVSRVPCVQKTGKGLAADLKELSKRFKYLVVDAGGRDSVELRAAMTVADKMFIPIQASQFDVWTLGTMDELIRNVSVHNENLRAHIVLTRASTNPSVNEANEAKEAFAEFENMKVIPTVIHDRISFRKAAKSGLSVCEITPADPKALDEVTSFYKCVLEAKEELAHAS